MKLYYAGLSYQLYNGNMLDMKEVIREKSIDAIVTDPPYELNFMNKGWDNSGIAFQKETWERCYDVLKPGGYLLAFGGTRTFHRIACAIEDAGFEIRDTIMWLYGSGFPKSMNIGLAIDKRNGVESEVVGVGKSGKEESHTRSLNLVKGGFGGEYDIKKAANEYSGWGTALKPSYEPIIVARKPCEGTCIDNVMKYGVGGINIDECRVGDEKHYVNINDFSNQHGNNFGNGKPIAKLGEKEVTGRFPANTILTYDDSDYEEVCGGMPETKGNGNIRHNKNDGKGYNCYSNYGDCDTSGYDDSGSAARYFYCAKASKRDRDEGLEAFAEKTLAYSNQAQAEERRGNLESNRTGMNRVIIRKNTHPTVKPTSLMQYLVRLVTPNGGTVLDPFNGSGSTGKAVMYENKDRNVVYKYIGIEMTEEYLPISKARIDFAAGEEDEPIVAENEQMTIFDMLGGA